jgi:DHA2 family metal-tetracycline-proton antiporter-like MFS transporter
MPMTAATQPAQLQRLVLLLCFTVFWSVLNGTMFNVAVPDIARQFSLTTAEVSWVVTGYITIFAVAATTYGKLADLYSVRRLMTIGLLLFNLGALLSLLATWYPLLVIGRLVQAAGGGAIPALVMIIATRYAPVGQRGRVLGAVAATIAFGMGLGPLVGGLLAGFLHWRWLFCLSFANLLVVLPIRRTLPREAPPGGRFDSGGAVLLGLGICALLDALTRQQILSLLAATLLLGWLRRHLAASPAPLIPTELLADRRFRMALLITCLILGAFFGLLFVIPLLLRQLYQVGTTSIGLAIFPGALLAALVGLAGGKLADRRGVVPVALTGLTCLCGSFLLLAWLAGRGPLIVSLLLVFSYAGFSLPQPALGKAVSLILPAELSGVGMGVYNLTYFVAGAIGTALAGSLIDWLDAGTTGAEPILAYQVVFLVSSAACALAALLFRRTFDNLPIGVEG